MRRLERGGRFFDSGQEWPDYFGGLLRCENAVVNQWITRFVKELRGCRRWLQRLRVLVREAWLLELG